MDIHITVPCKISQQFKDPYWGGPRFLAIFSVNKTQTVQCSFLVPVGPQKTGFCPNIGDNCIDRTLPS